MLWFASKGIKKTSSVFGILKALLLPLEHSELVWNHGLILMVLYNEQAFVDLFYHNSHFYPDFLKKPSFLNINNVLEYVRQL